jgi:hypothetical protein
MRTRSSRTRIAVAAGLILVAALAAPTAGATPPPPPPPSATPVYVAPGDLVSGI